jgi:hypothetical protein
MAGLGVLLDAAIEGTTVDYVSHENGPGIGLLTGGGGALAWKPPGGTLGDYVSLVSGNTYALQGGGSEEGKFVVVSRTSADSIDGATAATIMDVFNSLWDNVSNAERAAGDTEYRCLAFKVGPYSTVRDLKVWLGLLGAADAVDSSGYAASGAVTVTGQLSFADWLPSGYAKNDTTGEVLYYASRTDSALTVPAGGRDVWGDSLAAGSEGDPLDPIAGLRIGIEAPSSQPSGNFTAAADEDTDPGGITYKHPTSAEDVDVLTPPALSPGEIYGLWLERKVPAGAAATARARTLIEWSYTTAS